LVRYLFKTTASLFQKRIDYVLEFISQHPLLSGQIDFTRQENSNFDMVLSYGIQELGSFFIPVQKIIFSDNPSNFNQLVANKYYFTTVPIYSVEWSKTSEVKDFFSQKSFQFDIIETIFFHISRIEEWDCTDQNLDQWGMMKTNQQFLVKHQLHQIPVIDHLIYAFAQVLNIQFNPPKSTIRITHDIDETTQSANFLKSLRSSAGIIWRRQNWTSIIRTWKALFNNQKNNYDTFDWMLSDSATMEKCIYFLVDGKTKYDTPYDLGTPRMQTIFQMCKEKNYKIGIHPSYACWKNQKKFKEEKEKLEALVNLPIEISRQHYLHFNFKITPNILDQQKIKEDSTMGFNDRIGFRCGTGFGYHLYDFENEKPFNFIETPLIVMDSSLLMETNYDLEKTTQLWTSFLAKNKRYTKITFNFHNTRFYDANIHGIPLKKWYQELLLHNLDLDKTGTKTP